VVENDTPAIKYIMFVIPAKDGIQCYNWMLGWACPKLDLVFDMTEFGYLDIMVDSHGHTLAQAALATRG